MKRFGRRVRVLPLALFLMAALALVAALVAARLLVVQAPSIAGPGRYTVAEGTTSVATLTASDADTPSADLTWSLPEGDTVGADRDRFTLSSAGVLAFRAAKDYENPDDADEDGVYQVTVQVTDGAEADTADLSVTVSDVTENPVLRGPSRIDYPENRVWRVATYTTRDLARSSLTWSLAGADRASFTIDDGVLRFVLPPSPAPDYESPADADSDRMYEITVQAADAANTVTKDVTVAVVNVDEPGRISLAPELPRPGTTLTATLTDPDGVTGRVAWTWERSEGRTGWSVIAGAAAATYAPTAADSLRYLRATAAYADGAGTGKTARAITAYPPLTHELSNLAVTGASRAMYPPFNPEVRHYAVGCAQGDAVTLALSANDAQTRLAVNGIQQPGPDAVVDVAGLTGESDITITLSGSDGASTTYVVHCIYDEFPRITTQNPGGVAGLFLISAAQDDGMFAHIAIVDTNGVPRFHRRFDGQGGGSHFKFHRDGKHPYSYSRRVAFVTNFAGDVSRTNAIVVLDRNFDVVDEVQVVPPLTQTTAHDFVIRPNGNYIILSYEPAQRDLSRFVNDDREPYSTTEGTEDSVIQEITPRHAEVFRWNSWDHMAIADCTQHVFPRDYAHVNSIEVVEGDIVASFRGCSQVLRIDGTSGAVVWRLGKSNRADEEWMANGVPAPLTILNDPYGEFCGQHAARMLPNGNLILFDNGGHCLEDPDTGLSERVGGVFSRVVEYSLDPARGEAIFVRHHSLHGDFDRFARSQGHVEAMDNGHWLVSWGRGLVDDDPYPSLPPDQTLTEVDPETGAEVFSLRLQHANGDAVLHTRAYRLPSAALAASLGPLTATFPGRAETSAVELEPGDPPQVVVAFSRPVVDIVADTPSVSVSGASVARVTPHVEDGAPANAYRFTLTPTGGDRITVRLVPNQPCESGGICAPDGTRLAGG